ncbi:MAG: hypothetical protein ABDH91_00955 [Bacteroidia bacterium]
MRYALLGALVWAQDTIRVMAYNLLTYGATPGYCDTRCKDQQLRTIISFVRPHIIGVNEVGPSAALLRRLLDSVLNIGGVTYWRSSPYANTTNSNIVSALFYDSRRFGWLRQDLITTQGGLRDIYAYHLYYKEPGLTSGSDTLFLVAIVAHLKAGNTASDAQLRTQAATAIRQYIQSLPSNRQRFVIQMGDHNLYGASEQAYMELVSLLVDPGPAGEWSGNSAFAFYHTQSTRAQALSDGGLGGGLNDRFDFIFFSPACTTASARARYLPGSFRVIGQDGQHFRRGLNEAPLPAGYSAAVVNALYAMSDHLPVIADFALMVRSAITPLLETPATPVLHWRIASGSLTLWAERPCHFRLLDLTGRLWTQGYLEPHTPQLFYLPSGLYLLYLEEEGIWYRLAVW